MSFATLLFGYALIGISITLVAFIVLTLLVAFLVKLDEELDDRRRKREIAEKRWELPGQWGAQTTAQRDVLYELRDWRNAILDSFIYYSHFSSRYEDVFKKLEWVSIKIREHNLDPQLLTEFVRMVHEYYVKNRSWDYAARVVKKYNL